MGVDTRQGRRENSPKKVGEGRNSLKDRGEGINKGKIGRELGEMRKIEGEGRNDKKQGRRENQTPSHPLYLLVSAAGLNSGEGGGMLTVKKSSKTY